jgi:hypothetical protein
MKDNIYFEIISYYLSILEEMGLVSINALKANIKRIYSFSDDTRVKDIFYDELKEYFESTKIERDVCKFLLLNNRKLILNDIINTINRLDYEGEKKYTYIDSLINTLDISCDLDRSDKFYIPKNKPKYIKNINTYLNIAKGFSMDSVKDFLIDEEVYDDESFNETLSKIKYFNLVGGDTKYIAGIFDKGIVIPRVKDDLTTLIAIHELVHNSVLMNKDEINDNRVTYSEILPRFYENLYASNNCFIKEVIHKDEYTDKLLNDYKHEPMLEQAEKVRRLINE